MSLATPKRPVPYGWSVHVNPEAVEDQDLFVTPHYDEPERLLIMALRGTMREHGPLVAFNELKPYAIKTAERLVADGRKDLSVYRQVLYTITDSLLKARECQLANTADEPHLALAVRMLFAWDILPKQSIDITIPGTYTLRR